MRHTVYACLIHDQLVRFVRLPNDATRATWVVLDDLGQAVGLAPPLRHLLMQNMQAGGPQVARKLAIHDAIVVIVHQQPAIELLAVLHEQGFVSDADWRACSTALKAAERVLTPRPARGDAA